MGLKVNTGEPVVKSVELGVTHGSAVYINWRNLAEMMRKSHSMNSSEGIGGVVVNEHGIHVYFSDDPDELL